MSRKIKPGASLEAGPEGRGLDPTQHAPGVEEMDTLCTAHIYIYLSSDHARGLDASTSERHRDDENNSDVRLIHGEMNSREGSCNHRGVERQNSNSIRNHIIDFIYIYFAASAALRSFGKFGVPTPVTGSQPFVQLNPAARWEPPRPTRFQPFVTSMNASVFW